MKSETYVAGSTGGLQSLSPSQWLHNVVSQGAEAWRMDQKLVWMMILVPFFIAASGVLSGAISKDLYKWFTGEDRFCETLQVIFYATALVMCIRIVWNLWQNDEKVIACLFMTVTLGLFFLVGEELSWGQRIFGWATPQALEEVNKQKETNLHNINGVGATFKWVQMLVGAYGTLLPLLVLAIGRKRLGSFRKLADYVVPHLTLVPYFMFMFVWRLYRNLFEAPDSYYFAIAEYNEVMETILAIGFALFMLFQIRRMRLFQKA